MKLQKEVSVNCNGLYLLHQANGQMYMNMIISEPVVNPLMAKYSDGLYSGTEKLFY